jgi:hypothetical protein
MPNAVGCGMAAVTGVDCAGVMPQVTTGSISSALIFTTSS